MGIIFHADDYGLSKGITDSILDSVDNGIVSRVSIIPNGYAFDYAIEEYRKRPNLTLSIHLNFLEGVPLSEPAAISQLTDANGYFRHSFQSLWLRYLTRGPRGRDLLRQQLAAEIKNQLTRVETAVGKGEPLIVDSHQHFHMIPFVFDELMKLANDFNIQLVRIPREPFFMNLEDKTAISHYFGLNIVKQMLLNGLSRRNRPRLQSADIASHDHFIGVLFTGRMSATAVKKALSRIPDLQKETVEILFHPGAALESERHYWARYPGLRSFYLSENRVFEQSQAKDPDLAALGRQFETDR